MYSQQIVSVYCILKKKMGHSTLSCIFLLHEACAYTLFSIVYFLLFMDSISTYYENNPDLGKNLMIFNLSDMKNPGQIDCLSMLLFTCIQFRLDFIMNKAAMFLSFCMKPMPQVFLFAKKMV